MGFGLKQVEMELHTVKKHRNFQGICLLVFNVPQSYSLVKSNHFTSLYESKTLL